MPRHPDRAVPTRRLPSCALSVRAARALQAGGWVGASESPAGQARRTSRSALYGKSPPRPQAWPASPVVGVLPRGFLALAEAFGLETHPQALRHQPGEGQANTTQCWALGQKLTNDPVKMGVFQSGLPGAPASKTPTMALRGAPTPTVWNPAAPRQGLLAQGAAESSGRPHFFHSLWLG